MTGSRLADPGRQHATTVQVAWVPSVLARQLVTAGGLALAGGALAVRPALLVFAAPLLVALACWLRGPRAATLQVGAEIPQPTTTELAPVDLRASVRPEPTTGADLGSVRLRVRPEPFVEAEDDVLVALGDTAEGRWRLTPTRWGYWPAGTLVTSVVSAHRVWSAQALTRAPALTVYPPATAAARVPAPPHLRARLGPHVSRAPGAGIEFAGIRPYQPGDPIRRVNWVVSSKADTVMLNEHAQERMGDVVVLIDSIHDLGRPGNSTVDVSVRGAATVAQSYLTVADRVGVVAFGSMLRWLTPTTGVRHFYRVIETLLEARQARTYVDPSVERIPLSVLPSGALVVCFSPLVDTIAVEAVRDLRERAHPVVVVDVLAADVTVPAGSDDALAQRIWRLERSAARAALERIGVRIVPYAEVADGSMDWLRMVAERPGGARR